MSSASDASAKATIALPLATFAVLIVKVPIETLSSPVVTGLKLEEFDPVCANTTPLDRSPAVDVQIAMSLGDHQPILSVPRGGPGLPISIAVEAPG